VIEIHLLPSAGTRSRRRPARRAAAAGLRLPPFDRSLALIAGAWLIALGVIAYLHLSSNARLADLRVEQEAALRDSARYAVMRAQGDSLLAKEAIIAQKMQIIQEIDAARYTWPHMLDEISRALPPYIWLTSIVDAPADGAPARLRMEGRAGNYYALGKYIEDLEASPFLTGVRLVSSTRTEVDGRAVLQFFLDMSFQEPTHDAIQTVPLFAAQQEF
jgi:Tfp pilus assembly protein PilN